MTAMVPTGGDPVVLPSPSGEVGLAGDRTGDDVSNVVMHPLGGGPDHVEGGGSCTT